MGLNKTDHLGGGCGSDTGKQEAGEINDDFEGDFEPIGQGNFVLTHGVVFLLV